jgi:GNAT superfamily N-acetyltransferase
MRIEVSEESIASVAEYARIPIAFEVNEVLDVAGEPNGAAGFTLSARRVGTPYLKDYDAITRAGPTQWAQQFDVSKWGLIAARVDQQYVGGATVAYDTPGLDMLEGRSDLALLWDIRIAPSLRRRGVGSVLFEAAEAWASTRGCRQLKVETQNINVAACRFYARHGCVLRAAHPMAYPEFPDEIQLLWYKDLDSGVSLT